MDLNWAFPLLLVSTAFGLIETSSSVEEVGHGISLVLVAYWYRRF
jgi:hypothetical protein